MTNDFFQRLSFKLTKASIIVAFSLGALLAATQVYLDFNQKSRNIDSKMQRVLKLSSISAQSAIRNKDHRLAKEIIDSLKNYEFIHYIAIHDEQGNVLATHNTSLKKSNTSRLTQIIKTPSSRYSIPLVQDKTELSGNLGNL